MGEEGGRKGGRPAFTLPLPLSYVQRPRYQSGGALWPLASDALLVSLVIAQCVLAALLFARAAPWPALLVLPLIPTTLLFREAAKRLVEAPFRVLSLRAATDLDAADADDERGGERAADLFRQPAIEFDDDAHDALLAEARHLDAALRHDEELRAATAASVAAGAATAGAARRRVPKTQAGVDIEF